jgi:glycosyltransferase involved in cell wall biosynthesis
MALAEARGRLGSLGIGKLQPFFLHVGGNQWYKNRLGVLRIFRELLETPTYAGHHLVMAGKPWRQEMHAYIDQHGFNHRVQELINVSDEDLHALYSGADALLFPSFQEGFGWPIIEAQACGCPVVTTNRPPMTEIGGSAAVYIDPQDEVAAAGLIEAALRNAEALKVAGLQNVTRFGRDAMLNGYLHAYRTSLSNSGRIAD